MDSQDKFQRLREQGLLLTDELPPEYAAVVEGLTPNELEVIVAVKKRLDEADRVAGTPSAERLVPGFVNYMIF